MGGKLFGARLARLEDPALLRGRARFVDDIRLPGMAHGCFLHSPHAHAAIHAIDRTAALAQPGVLAVLTLDELRPYLVNPRLVVGMPSASYRQEHSRPALADGEVAYVGEPVALVVAESRYAAEDAAALIEVEYEPLPVASDCRDALAPGAPLAHLGAPHNLLAEFDMAYGDVDAAFAGAAHVFGESIRAHRGGSHSIECRGCVGLHDPMGDRLTLWVNTQMPHLLQRVLVEMTGRDEGQLRVVAPEVGGGFGPKLVVYQEHVCIALAAIVTDRPVKWVEDRREHFINTTQERDQYWEAEIAVDGDGRILGLRGAVIHDHGAYTARGVNLAYNSAETVTLPYAVPAYRMNVKLALTNKVPVTPVRGAGHPQAVLVMERLLDRVARELNIDRAEVRRRNLIPGSAMPYSKPLKARGGMPILLDSGDYPKCQDAALARAGWADFRARQEAARREGRHIGIGVANYVKGTGRGPFEAVTVRIGTSGKIQVVTGGVAIGQGTRTMMAQLVGDQLGGDVNNIALTGGDTAAIALGIGTSGSRLAVMAGTSAHAAAQKVRAKALKIAAHMLESAEEDLEIVGGEIRVKGVSGMKVTLAQAASAVAGTPGYALPDGITPGLEATETVIIDDMAFASGTAVAEVEVDAETGAVKILNYVMGHDSGTIINPMIVDGQVIGGVAHGIGNALYEWMGYDDSAQPVTTTLAEYLLVSPTEMPHVNVIHQESPSPLNPLGVKGVGECGVVPAPAAIASAIEDALSPFGVRIRHTPIRPAEIVALIAEARGRRG